MAFVKLTLRAINGLARLFGVLCLLAAGFFVVGAIMGQDRLLSAVVGLALVLIGVLALRAKPITDEHISRIRSMSGDRRP